MIDLSKYNLDKEDIEFIQGLYDYEISQVNVGIVYKDNFIFDMDVYGGKVHVFRSDEDETVFDNVDDMLLHCIVDGKPMIEQIPFIDEL